MSTATSTRLHRSKTTGEWVPCHATKRPCPREHISVSASGDLVAEKSDMLADVVATVKRRNKGKSVSEQLEAVRAIQNDLHSKEKPYMEASKELHKIERELITQKWTEAEPRDYLALDDYDGVQTLMDDAFSDSAASDYQKRYIKSLDSHLEVSGYDSTRMLPGLKLSTPYGMEQEELQHLADAMGKWSSFILAHRNDESNTNGTHRNYRDAWSDLRDEEEAEGAPFERIEVYTEDYEQTRGLRVYADGTATPEIKLYSRDRVVDTSTGDGRTDAEPADYYAARRPIVQVLSELNKVWYFPASSKPGYREPKSEWEDGYDEDYDRDPFSD
jgi:hypothetical protein